jgi:adenylate kinase family enzyme
MFVKLFVLGRPGSGKSTAVRHMVELFRKRNYSATCIKDYDILYKMFQKDREQKRFRPADYEGFDVMDTTVFDTALKVLESDILAISSSGEKKIITIEFARDDYHSALKLFNSEFLKDSYIFYVDVDLQSCIDRIHKRVETPSEPDHHFVSDYIMRTYYKKDNWIYMSSLLKKEYPFFKDVFCVYNTGLLSDLLAKVNDFAEMLLREEFNQQEQLVNHTEALHDHIE